MHSKVNAIKRVDYWPWAVSGSFQSANFVYEKTSLTSRYLSRLSSLTSAELREDIVKREQCNKQRIRKTQLSKEENTTNWRQRKWFQQNKSKDRDERLEGELCYTCTNEHWVRELWFGVFGPRWLAEMVVCCNTARACMIVLDVCNRNSCKLL